MQILWFCKPVTAWSRDEPGTRGTTTMTTRSGFWPSWCDREGEWSTDAPELPPGARVGESVRVKTRSAFSAPRLARPDESRSIADLWLRSRHASIPAIPAPVHSGDDVREWFASVVVTEREPWVITSEDRPAALLVLDHGWVDQLYVDPKWTGHGLGSVLINVAKERNPDTLDLWTFASNRGARRFYERHGFQVIASTDDDNEEG